jgi:hypothetical protein
LNRAAQITIFTYTKSEDTSEVKTDMSKQYNKAEKRARRARQLKRKKLAAKARNTSKAKAKVEVPTPAEATPKV